MSKRAVLLNGPPRSGKDTAGDFLLQVLEGVRIKFSDPVKDGTHASYGMKGIDTNHYEDRKDEPNSDFLGLSPRKAYILHSENYMKPIHGKDVFGQIAAQRISRCGFQGLYVVPDSGFVDEALPVVDLLGAKNVLLLRCHREGKTFDGDSRSYIVLPGVKVIDVVNPEGHINAYLDRVRDHVLDFLKGIYDEA